MLGRPSKEERKAKWVALTFLKWFSGKFRWHSKLFKNTLSHSLSASCAYKALKWITEGYLIFYLL